MNLYLLTQTEAKGYDTFDSCVVVASSHAEAQRTLPRDYLTWEDLAKGVYNPWASKPENVQVQYLGVASPYLFAGVVCASFNAG